MIGVLCRDSDREIVQEFFQLFKTPWEFYREGRKYRVVISNLSNTQPVEADLLISYHSMPSPFDAQIGLFVDSSVSHQFPCRADISIPIYGQLVSLRGVGTPLAHAKETGENFAIMFLEEGRQRLRVGYDLFQEIAFLLTEGQPVENARIPTLELHISLLREWIVGSGIPLVEIPPLPWGHQFIACLTHDVDFAGIRRHKLDHTMWGFVYRALVSSTLKFFRGTCSFDHLARNWLAVFSLPLVYLGILDDFWDHFDRYAELEKGLSSTFFLIPFKRRVGEKVHSAYSARRATRYDIDDVREQVKSLASQGCEIGLHGIDAWHSIEKGKQELSRIVQVTGQKNIGVRIHWLCFDHRSAVVLGQTGFLYDATSGYNETIGYKAGTTQVFKPLRVAELLELPLHIQDTALFYPRRLGLTDTQAWELCESLLKMAVRFGGILTVSWHERSLAPERLWGEFYKFLLQELQARGAWFGTAGQIIHWFRVRRSVVFEDSSFAANSVRLRLKCEDDSFEPCMILRVHRPQAAASRELYSGPSYIDARYTGESSMEIPLD